MEVLPLTYHTESNVQGPRSRTLALAAIELQKQSSKPPGGDPLIAARSAAMLNEIESGGSFSEIIEWVGYFHEIYSPTGRSPSDIIGKIGATIDTYLLRTDESFPSKEFRQPKRWIQPLRELRDLLIDTPHDPNSEEFTVSLMIKNVMTSIPRRYITVELITQIMGDRFPNGIRWLDIGSGAMQGVRQLVLKDKYPYDNLKISGIGRAIDPTISTAVNKLLRRPSLIKSVVCSDREYIYDNRHRVFMPGVEEWARGSLRPGVELADKRFMSLFNDLLKESPDNVHFHFADFTDESSLDEFVSQYGENQFDLVTRYTMTHQLSPEQRKKIRSADKHLLKLGGIAIEQDFQFGRGKRPKTLEPYQHWHVEGNYRTHVRDSLDPEGTFQEVFRNKDSRISALAPGIGKLLVRGKYLLITEAILSAV